MKKRGLTALALAGALLLSTPAFAAEEKEAVIRLSDAAVTVDGKAAATDPTAAVYVGADIVYYEDLESGTPPPRRRATPWSPSPGRGPTV